jgi:hypothetical protein
MSNDIAHPGTLHGTFRADSQLGAQSQDSRLALSTRRYPHNAHVPTQRTVV